MNRHIDKPIVDTINLIARDNFRIHYNLKTLVSQKDKRIWNFCQYLRLKKIKIKIIFF